MYNVSVQPWQPDCLSLASDVLIFGAYGGCKCRPSTFAGRILLINGEDHQPPLFTSRTLQIGAGGEPFSFGAMEWMIRDFYQYTGPVEHYAVAYANSNCVFEREMMIQELSSVVPVHAFGRCTGFGSALEMPNGRGRWESNVERFKGYAFVFAAEHQKLPGYVTEKPFVAAAAGAIPIYWGDESLLSEFMNPQRILFWNTSTPQLVKSLMHSSLRDLKAVDTQAILQRSKDVISRFMDNTWLAS